MHYYAVDRGSSHVRGTACRSPPDPVTPTTTTTLMCTVDDFISAGLHFRGFAFQSFTGL